MTLLKVNNPALSSFDGWMKEFFNDFSTSIPKTEKKDVLHYPPVNIIELEQSYQLEFLAPGYRKEDFEITLNDNIVSVRASKKNEITEENKKIVRKEFSYSGFKRSFTIDDKIDAERMEAAYENGILNLTLPKKEAVKPEIKQIAVK